MGLLMSLMTICLFDAMSPDKQSALIQRILTVLAIEGRTVRELSIRCGTGIGLMRHTINKMYDDGLIMVIGHKMSGNNKTAIFAPWQEDLKDLGIISHRWNSNFDVAKKVECYGVWGM